MAAKDLGKKKRGKYDYRLDEANDFILVKWHDNAVVSVVGFLWLCTDIFGVSDHGPMSALKAIEADAGCYDDDVRFTESQVRTCFTWHPAT